MRLSLYKRLATAKSDTQIDSLLEEMVDRFGKLPDAAQTLLHVHRLRVLAHPYGVRKVDATAHATTITFKAQAPVEPLAIIDLIQKNRHIKLVGNEKLRVERTLETPRARFDLVRDVLRALGPVNTM